MKRKKILSLLVIITLLLTAVSFPVAMAASSISSGEYYINNKSTGHYLGRGTTIQGKLSSIKSSINWHINMVDSTWCTLSPAASAPVYLCYNNITNQIYVSTGSAVSDECLWNFTLTSNGILIKNKATSTYLYASGTSLYLSSTKYASSYWRSVSTASYGNTTDYSYRELTSFTTVIEKMDMGTTQTISLKKYPSSSGTILWADTSDFKFSISEGSSYASVNSGGVITAKKPGKSKLTIIHKPTGYSINVFIYIYADASLLGVSDGDHDHESAVQEVNTILKSFSYDYNTILLKTGNTNTVDEVINMLKYSKLFISKGHGGEDETNNTNMIWISDTSYIKGTDLYDWENNVAKNALNTTKICAFVGCLTDSPDVTHGIARSAYMAGANASVGFEETIECESANIWITNLANELVAGETIEDACYDAYHDGLFGVSSNSGLDSYYIYGDKSQTL